MVAIGMKLMPPKVIRTKVCLRARSIFGLSKDLGPKRCPNIWRREESKEMKDFMKVEEGGVHHKRYEDHCMKQWIKILKATWTSSIIKKRSTWGTSFNMPFFMKDDVNDEMPNGIPKTLIPFDEVVNWDGVLKLGNRLEGDHVTHLWGWIERLIT